MDATALAPLPRRGLRDWVADTCLFLLAALFWLGVVGGRLTEGATRPAWLFALDVIAGGAGVLALWLRRRWPVGLAATLIVLSAFSESVAGAMIVGLLTVAVHRPPRTTAIVFGLSLLAALAYVFLRPEPGTPSLLLFLLGVALQGGAVGWGLFVRHRRQLALSLRDRATRAETEARLRAEQAQHRAREEIAREMHDVLGHRLSLLSVHAGALEFRPDAPADEVARAAKVIRESAHQALQDLREVIGVLRAPVAERSQPTLADVQLLVAESRRAGMPVDLRADTGAVPDGLGRTAYRIVQEALTNARKHAHGAEVTVSLTGAPGTGLTVEVVNAAPAADPAADPEADPEATAATGPAPPGQGLVGLAERVALADGRLEQGPTTAGGWRLAAWLPWPP